MSIYEDDLPRIVKILKNGGIILCPTDTIWGLSCDALNEAAVSKIFSIKNRPKNKPLILLTHSLSQLKKYIVDIHPRIETLVHYHLRPLSIVYKASPNLPDYLKNEDGTVAIRVTKDPVLSEIIQLLDAPIVSTSANLSGDPLASRFDEIHPSVKQQVDYMFNMRRNETNFQSSMLISFDDEGELIFIRK